MKTTAGTAVAKALAAWGNPLPVWVMRLAEEVDASSLAAAGARIGYGKSALSMVLANRYGAGTAKVQAAVEELLCPPPAALECPVLGPIAAERCLTEQAAPFRPHNVLARLLRAACLTCRHRTVHPSTERGAP